jgi:membrane associated rhomboid family serine protease
LNEKKETSRAAIRALILTALPWMVFEAEYLLSINLKGRGLMPGDMHGLCGIVWMPLLHADLDHILSNIPPLFLLLFGLFLLYRRRAWQILLCLWLVSGLMTWYMGRPGTVHLGASGLAYALAAFHFTGGVIRRSPQQMAFAMVVAFLYGGFVWAFFPSLYRYTQISWEGHLSGLLTGITFAFYFRRSGPPPPPDPFADEEDTAEDTGEWAEK